MWGRVSRNDLRTDIRWYIYKLSPPHSHIQWYELLISRLTTLSELRFDVRSDSTKCADEWQFERRITNGRADESYQLSVNLLYSLKYSMTRLSLCYEGIQEPCLFNDLNTNNIECNYCTRPGYQVANHSSVVSSKAWHSTINQSQDRGVKYNPISEVGDFMT